MQKPNIPADEKERLVALKSYSILDTIPEKEYDEITYLASFICGTPISLITLIDEKRQWFKSHNGVDAQYTPREFAFCAHAINDKNQILIVPDSRNDERFKDNPLVTGDPYVIFYVGIPLVNPEGYALGTLCIIDSQPRQISEEQLKALKALSNQLLMLLELRKKSMDLLKVNNALESQNSGLKYFTQVAAHDLKSPLSSISMVSNLILEKYSEQIPSNVKKLNRTIFDSSQRLISMIEGILNYSTNTNLIVKDKVELNVNAELLQILNLLDPEHTVNFKFEAQRDLILYCNKTVFYQIFSNLISNSIKYNDKQTVQILVNAYLDENKIHFRFSDNGPGIKDNELSNIFNLFATTSNKDKSGMYGTGIGLATVKSLIENLGGSIRASSQVNEGLNYDFCIPT